MSLLDKSFKSNLFLDFDGTIADSIAGYCEAYKLRYSGHPDYKVPDPNKVQLYNLQDECPLEADPPAVFTADDFWDNVRLMDKDTAEVIGELTQKYNVIVCSVGRPRNIAKKAIWLKENLPVVQGYIFLYNGEGCVMNKSIVNMSGGILIDDHIGNLNSSNAEIKVCFGTVYDWNKDWTGTRCFTWKAVGKLLL